MPGKDKVDLRQCVELLTEMLQNEDNAGVDHSAAPRSSHRTARGRKVITTTGRPAARHEASFRPSSHHSRATSSSRTGGRTACRGRQPMRAKPATTTSAEFGDDDCEWEADDAGTIPQERTSNKQNKHTSTFPKRLMDHDASVEPVLQQNNNTGVMTNIFQSDTIQVLLLEECSCLSTNAVPFNQRLLSSTPTGTPKRKRLVERQGVLMLNGSTETQILNSTDTAAAVRPPSPPRPCGPCLARGEVQFAAAPYKSSSISSIPSSAGSCEEDVVDPYPLYSVAASHSVPHRSSSIPSSTVVPSTACEPRYVSSQPVARTVGQNSYAPVTSSLGPEKCRHDVPVSHAAGHFRSESGRFYDPITASAGLGAPRVSSDHFHPPRSPTRAHPSAPCGCAQLTVPTNIMSTSVAGDQSRPPVTLTASSSQDTIEIHLEHSPERSKTRERFPMVKGLAKEKTSRRRPRTATVRDRQTSTVNRLRQQRCASKPRDIDTERVMSLLKQLKAIVTANRNPEITQLLNEICEAALTSPLFPASQTAESAGDNSSSHLVEQLQNEIAQLNRQLQLSKQQLREKEELVSALRKPDESCQVDRMSVLMWHLEKQLEESRAEVETLRRRMDLLSTESERTGRDKAALLQTISEKDEERLRELADRDNTLRETQKLLDAARAEKRDCEQKLTTANRGLQSVTLQLEQKDTEIQRSRNLVRDLHQSMSRLVHDLQSCHPATTVASSSSLMSVHLGDTLTRINRQLHQLEPLSTPDRFVTPPLRVEADRAPRSAQRSLDFGRTRLNSDPLSATSNPDHLSNRSCPDMSSYLDTPSLQQQQHGGKTSVDVAVLPTRQSVGSTTVKALLSPIAQRLQASSPALTPQQCGRPQTVTSDHLDQTLTEAGDNSQLHNHAPTDADRCMDSQTVDESSQSRWSVSDYFSRYPNARLDSSGNTTWDGILHSSSSPHRCADVRDRLQQPAGRHLGADNETSTLISSIQRNRSPPQRHSPCSASSVEGSVQTSSSLDSISTNDDAAFRAGLAQLDANIALVQQRLRGSLSSPSPACRSPRSNSDQCF